MKNIYDFLQERGYIYQQTNPDKIKELLSGKEKITFYFGVDPTASSLHIGHFFGLMLFKYLQEAGHQGILLFGGATAMIGDPSGRQDMRKMMSKEEIENNIKAIVHLAKKFIVTEGDNAAIVVNNADWTNNQSYIDFMRNVGIHFNVNKMLAAETYKKRMEEGGLTFLEMGYMLIQANDFAHLYKTHHCIMQIGGSDQWSNILAGYELIRKTEATEIFGITFPLLANSEGEKMGKTAKGALWVDYNRTSVYDFYQYWVNIQDKDVSTMLRLLTKIPLSEIIDLCNKDIVDAKKKMAFLVTELIHGTDETNKVVKISEEIFQHKGLSEDMPTKILNSTIDMPLVDLLIMCGLVTSKSEARRMIQQGGISLHYNKVDDINRIVTMKDLKEGLVVGKGKKQFVKVIVK